MKVAFTVLLLEHFSSCCFYAYQPSSLEEIHFSDVRNALFWNRYETSRSASTPFFAVLACFEDRSTCSCVSSEGLDGLACDGTGKGNDARQTLFAFLFSLFVLALTFRRPARLRPRLHRTVAI